MIHEEKEEGSNRLDIKQRWESTKQTNDSGHLYTHEEKQATLYARMLYEPSFML
jgi:hypothetical protein